MTEDAVTLTNAWDRALAVCGVKPDQADEIIDRFPYEPIDALEIRVVVEEFFDRLFMHFADYLRVGEFDPLLLSLTRCFVNKALNKSAEHHALAHKLTDKLNRGQTPTEDEYHNLGGLCVEAGNFTAAAYGALDGLKRNSDAWWAVRTDRDQSKHPETRSATCAEPVDQLGQGRDHTDGTEAVLNPH